MVGYDQGRCKQMSLTHEYVYYDGSAIICDTNIWYKRGSDISKRYPLVATWLSVYELFKASNRNPGTRISNWARIRDESVYIMHLSPEQHFHFYRSKGEIIHPEIFEEQKATVGRYNSILERKRSGNLTDEQWEMFESSSVSIRTDYNGRFEKWANQLTSLKKKIKTTDEKKEFLNSPEGVEYHLHNVAMPLIIVLLTDTKYEDVGDIETDDFSKFELFINVFNYWLIEIDLGKETVTANDLIDVFNMIYVTPIDKYWTNESKWIEKIKAAGMARYIFYPEK